MAQLVRDARVVLWDRRRQIVYDDAAVRVKWGVPPESIPDWLALVGDSSDGYPGLPGFGAKTAAALLDRFGHLEDVPIKGSAWGLGGVRNQVGLAQVLRERLPEAMLYRDLARLRTTADGVEIPQRKAAELEWLGTPRPRWEAFCDEWGLDRLRARPHRWAEG
jgi:5'-3' exonuclease